MGIDYKKDKLETIKEQFAMLSKYYSERFAVMTMRKQLVQYFKGEGLSNGTKLKILTQDTIDGVLQLLAEVLKK